jgi:AcrR family transcriptional regulator
MSDGESLWSVKRRQARTDLIAAALDLFETKGFAQTTVAEVAAAATQSPRTFFRYFGSKEEVLFDDIEEHLELLRTEIAANLAAGEAPWPAVTHALRQLLITHLSPGDARRRMQLWLREPALRTRYMDHSRRWEAVIAKAVGDHRGEHPLDDVYARAVAVAAIGGFRVASEVADSGEGDFLARLTESLELLGAGLDIEPPRRRPRRRAGAGQSRR